MTEVFLRNFKTGVADALFSGVMRSSYDQSGGYKEGYDFGIVLYGDLNNLNEREE